MAWLNDALAERHPGVRVAGVEIVRVDELTNTHVRLRVSYDEPAGAPERMFAKLPPLDPARRESLAASNMGPEESRFYAELAPVVTMRVPAMYAARYDDRDRSFVQLLEDLDATGCTVPDGRHGVTPDAAAGALEDLADLHLQFEDPAERSNGAAAWVPDAARGSRYGATLLQYGLDHHRDRLSADFAAISELYIDHEDVLAVALARRTRDRDPRRSASREPLRRPRPHRLPRLGTHQGEHADARRELLPDLRARHRRPPRARTRPASATTSRFATPVVPTRSRIDEAWRSHRLLAAYLVPACCQVVTFPADMSEQRRVFSEAFFSRPRPRSPICSPAPRLREVAGI